MNFRFYICFSPDCKYNPDGQWVWVCASVILFYFAATPLLLPDYSGLLQRYCGSAAYQSPKGCSFQDSPGIADDRAINTRIDMSETCKHFINLDDLELWQVVKFTCEA
jgi:hypothetical protein